MVGVSNLAREEPDPSTDTRLRRYERALERIASIDSINPLEARRLALEALRSNDNK